MEVLGNIWNFLTIENEMVTNIVIAPLVVIETWLGFLLLSSILNFNYKPKQKIIYITFVSIVTLSSEFIIPKPYNIIFNYLALFIFIKIYFKLNIIKTILAIIIPTSIYAIINTLLLKPFLVITNLSYTEAYSVLLYRLIYLSILYPVVFIVAIILKNIKTTLHFVTDLSRKNKIIILLNTLLGFFTLCIQLTITYFYIDILHTGYILLSFVSLLAYFFISFLSLNKIMELQITTQNLESAENYNKTLSILYDNVKAFKHDFDNMIFTIGGFINTNDMNGLKIYYKSLEKECQNINNLALLNPTLINNPGIYNLLAMKYQKAQDENVELQFEFFFDLKALHMPIYDFSRILGIFLDNAIEAASVSNEKIVTVMFRDSQKSNVQIVQIKNSYVNKNIDTKNIFEKGITEKENHLGMGLWEVKQILKRNNNVNLITENNDSYFTQLLEIYY